MVRQSCGSKLGSHTRLPRLSHVTTPALGDQAVKWVMLLKLHSRREIGLQYVLSYLRKQDDPHQKTLSLKAKESLPLRIFQASSMDPYLPCCSTHRYSSFHLRWEGRAKGPIEVKQSTLWKENRSQSKGLHVKWEAGCLDVTASYLVFRE